MAGQFVASQEGLSSVSKYLTFPLPILVRPAAPHSLSSSLIRGRQWPTYEVDSLTPPQQTRERERERQRQRLFLVFARWLARSVDRVRLPGNMDVESKRHDESQAYK
jgi:hypothetical protein